MVTMDKSKKYSILAKKISNVLISNSYIKNWLTELANFQAPHLCFCICACILLCKSGKCKSKEVAAEPAGSRRAVFHKRKTNDLANARTKNPKMVNEISFESLRGPIIPRRANGRVIFRVSPRKKTGKILNRVNPASSCQKDGWQRRWKGGQWF